MRYNAKIPVNKEKLERGKEISDPESLDGSPTKSESGWK
jgi:hypothetical protein